jgi:hypothetical protein
MIDLANETTLSLENAARFCGRGRGGKPTHLSTILRWILKGSRSLTGQVVRLEAVRFGGRWLTSKQALQRFAEALTPQFDDRPKPRKLTPIAREKAKARAAAHLDAVGI